MNDKNKINLSFAAIDPTIQQNKVLGIEKEYSGQDFVYWGEDNHYPAYLNNLYLNTPTLQSVINTCVDYICGNGTISKNPIISNDDMEVVLYEMALSYMKYGGFAINVLRNRIGQISKLCVMDYMKIRVSKNGKHIYFAENYTNKAYARMKWKEVELFDKDKVQMNSVFYYKNSKYTTYPIPVYSAAITACELERSIDDYHLNSINNGFMGSVIVNLNNGIPTDEQQEEIARNFNEKFSGKENAGRVVISYSEDKDHQASIEKVETEDFSERYQSLAKRSQQAIFTAFRITPTLCGIPTENDGFNSEEYDGQFKLFNRTVIYPIQKKLIHALKEIGVKVTIKPFAIDLLEEENNDEKIDKKVE